MGDCLQLKFGFPTLRDKLFSVDVSFPPHKVNVITKNGNIEEKEEQSRWTEIIKAKNEKDAEYKVKEYYKRQKYLNDATIGNPKPFKPRFDGGENPEKWQGCGIPKNAVPDQYVSHCTGRGINLHIYKLGSYKECSGCGCTVGEVAKGQSRLCDHGDVHDVRHDQQKQCGNTAACAGEQAEG